MKHVLEHTPEPRVALAEVPRILPTGGTVDVCVSAQNYWKGWLMRRTYRIFRLTISGCSTTIYYSQRA